MTDDIFEMKKKKKKLAILFIVHLTFCIMQSDNCVKVLSIGFHNSILHLISNRNL